MRYFVLVFALCYSLVGQSQVVSGRVINSENGRGIAYANVFYAEILQGTIADSLGNFQLKVIEKLKNIHISAVGFCDQIIPVNEIASTQIKLTPRLYQIDEISVVGTQSKELILGCCLKNPKAMTILDETNGSGFFMYFPGHFDAKLNSIGLHISKIINPKIKLHFRLLDPDTTFHSLGFDKLKSDKYLENLQKGWNDIELGDENIRFSKNGIIVFFYFTDSISGDTISISCSSNNSDYSWMSSTNYSKDYSFGRKQKPAMRLKIYQ